MSFIVALNDFNLLLLFVSRVEWAENLMLYFNSAPYSCIKKHICLQLKSKHPTSSIFSFLVTFILLTLFSAVVSLLACNDVYDELLLPSIFSSVVYISDCYKSCQQEKVWSIETDVKGKGCL